VSSACSWVISWPSVAVPNRVSEDDLWGQAEPFNAAIVVQQNKRTADRAPVDGSPGATVDLHHCGTCFAQPIRIGVADDDPTPSTEGVIIFFRWQLPLGRRNFGVG
jgi:hypothetical protein